MATGRGGNQGKTAFVTKHLRREPDASDEAINLREVPRTIAIIGCGAVGVEFGSIFRRFGSEVTLIELLPHLVPVEDESVSAELEKSFAPTTCWSPRDADR